MRRLHCPTCGNEVFFDSLACVRCGTAMAMDIVGGAGDVVPVDAGGAIVPVDAARTTPCANRLTWACNWLAAGPGAPLCRSCVLVDAGPWMGDASMPPFQAAQRRALAQLSALGVPWGDGAGPRLKYRKSSGGDDAVIGHRRGEITLDLDEVDPARREHVRATLGEAYRTPLGHLRHELGHAVWERLVAPAPAVLEEFRAVFGDERTDYAAALGAHYARGDDGAWRTHFVSFYATAHPWEDFAESWAQLLHVHDVVETGAAWGVVAAPADASDVAAWLSASVAATLAANELARAMGSGDLYPFLLSPVVRDKVAFCWRLVRTPPA